MTKPVERLEEQLEETVEAIVEVEPHPEQWSGWIVKMLEKLERKTPDLGEEALEEFENGLEILVDTLDDRLDDQRWYPTTES